MSCFVVNDSCRPVHVTLDKDEDRPFEHRYNLILSHDAPDKKRHLEQFMLNPNRRRQLYSLFEPFAMVIESRLKSSFWEQGADLDGSNLILVKDFQ